MFGYGIVEAEGSLGKAKEGISKDRPFLVIPYISSMSLFMKTADWISLLALAVQLLLLAGLMWYCFETRGMRIATRQSLDLAQKQLGLLEHQTQSQERVELYFDLTCKDGGLRLRVSNLGLSNFC